MKLLTSLTTKLSYCLASLLWMLCLNGQAKSYREPTITATAPTLQANTCREEQQAETRTRYKHALGTIQAPCVSTVQQRTCVQGKWTPWEGDLSFSLTQCQNFLQAIHKTPLSKLELSLGTAFEAADLQQTSEYFYTLTPTSQQPYRLNTWTLKDPYTPQKIASLSLPTPWWSEVTNISLLNKRNSPYIFIDYLPASFLDRPTLENLDYTTNQQTFSNSMVMGVNLKQPEKPAINFIYTFPERSPAFTYLNHRAIVQDHRDNFWKMGIFSSSLNYFSPTTQDFTESPLRTNLHDPFYHELLALKDERYLYLIQQNPWQEQGGLILELLDVHEPKALKSLRHFPKLLNALQSVEDMQIEGNLLYIVGSSKETSNTDTLLIMDITDHLAPEILSTYPLPAAYHHSNLRLLDGYAYLWAMPRNFSCLSAEDPLLAFTVIDISEPWQPHLISLPLNYSPNVLGLMPFRLTNNHLYLLEVEKGDQNKLNFSLVSFAP